MASQKMETERWGKTHSLTHISASPLCWLMMLCTSSYVLEVKGIPFHSKTCIPRKTNLSTKSNMCVICSLSSQGTKDFLCFSKPNQHTFQRTPTQCSPEHHVVGHKLTWMYNTCLRQHAKFALKKNLLILTKHMHSVHTSVKKIILNKQTGNCNH